MTTPVEWHGPEAEPGPAPGVEFAGYGERFVAYLLDSLLLGVVATVLAVIGFILYRDAPILGVIAFAAAIVVSFAYYPYYWVKSGQTPGKKAVRIKVVRDVDGGPLGWGSAILRMVGIWIGGLVFYLGYIWVFIDKRRRGWHDLMASTVVIKV